MMNLRTKGPLGEASYGLQDVVSGLDPNVGLGVPVADFEELTAPPGPEPAPGDLFFLPFSRSFVCPRPARGAPGGGRRRNDSYRSSRSANPRSSRSRSSG